MILRKGLSEIQDPQAQALDKRTPETLDAKHSVTINLHEAMPDAP